MKYFRSVSILFLFVVAVGFVAATSGRPTIAEDTSGLSWVDSITPEITKTRDLTAEEYNSGGSHTNFPCVYEDVHTWGSNGIGIGKAEYTFQGCTLPVDGGKFDVGNNAVITQGVGHIQRLKDDTLDRLTFYPAANSSKLAVISNSYNLFYGGTPTLYLVDDWKSTFTNYSVDSYQNVTRQPSKPYDFVLKYSNGDPVYVRSNGMSFSANGVWLVVGVPNKSHVLINTETKQVLPFGTYMDSSYAIHSAVSNDGRYIVMNKPFDGLYMYDTQSCQSDQGEMVSRYCASREVSGLLKDFTGKNDLRITDLNFIGAANMLQAKVAWLESDGVTWKYAVYRMRLPGTTPDKYLALGDSFSSGEGAYDYRSPTDFYLDNTNYNLCHQSRNSYPYVLQSFNKFEWFNSVACSGAMIDDIKYDVDKYISDESQAKTPSIATIQRNSLDKVIPGYIPQIELNKEHRPTTVTVSIVGNDIGFGEILTACILNKLTIITSGECFSGRDDREAVAGLIDLEIPRLSQLLSDVKSEMGGSDPKLYVLGYPKVISPEGTCGLNSPLTGSEIAFANNMVAYLNTAVKVAADSAGAQYIDVSDAFISGESDYRLCGSQSNLAMNGIVLRGSSTKNPDNIYYSETFHPNKLGQSLIASVVQAQTGGLTKPMPQSKNSLNELVEKRIALVGDNEKRLGEYTLLYNDKILSNNHISIRIAPKEKPLELKVEADNTLLPPAGEEAVIEFHSTPIIAGTLPIAADGSIHGTVSIPNSLAAGYHQLHVKYKDISGRTIDRYAYVYVAESEQDYDGDGRVNAADACLLGRESGVDNDKDGIDDACDDEYVLSDVSDSNKNEDALMLETDPWTARSGITSKAVESAAADASPTSNVEDVLGATQEKKLAFSPTTGSGEQAQKASSDTRSHEPVVANPWPRVFVIIGALMALLGLVIKLVWFPKS